MNEYLVRFFRSNGSLQHSLVVKAETEAQAGAIAEQVAEKLVPVCDEWQITPHKD